MRQGGGACVWPYAKGCGMTGNIFTYGSLMFDEVWRQVVNGRYRSAPATLHHHQRHALTGLSYPGVVAAPDVQVAGRLYFDVSADDMARLDAFEGAEYRRAALQVMLAGGEPASAWTYIWLDPQRLSGQPWLSDTFQLGEFLQTYPPAAVNPDGNPGS
jgi:gamma-glutamylcyclotransferase (GGCT)/AIG2-like uncharacterized protein YtfP